MEIELVVHSSVFRVVDEEHCRANDKGDSTNCREDAKQHMEEPNHTKIAIASRSTEEVDYVEDDTQEEGESSDNHEADGCHLK
jgi:hypothetical protein